MSQSYSVGCSSDVAFRCQCRSNSLLLRRLLLIYVQQSSSSNESQPNPTQPMDGPSPRPSLRQWSMVYTGYISSTPVVDGLHGESVEFPHHLTPLQNRTLARHVLIMSAVFKLGSADQRGSATGSHGVRERIPKSSNCLHGF